MSYCIECIFFVRRGGNTNQKCEKNNPIRLNCFDAKCESLFRNCSDYMLDKERFFARDNDKECKEE